MMWNNSVELDDVRKLLNTDKLCINAIDCKTSNVQVTVVTLDEQTFTYKRSLRMFDNRSRTIFFRSHLNVHYPIM